MDVCHLLRLPGDVLRLIVKSSATCSLVLPHLSAAYDFYMQPGDGGSLQDLPQKSPYDSLFSQSMTQKGGVLTHYYASKPNAPPES
jgi:hypothetical protein